MMSFGSPLDVKTRYDAIPIKMYKIVHTIGNKMRGGNKGGLFSWSIMEKLSAVREDASSPTKSGRRTHRIKSAVFCKVVFRNRKTVKLIFGNKKITSANSIFGKGKKKTIFKKNSTERGICKLL